ncbi:MAG: NAD(P)H-hydrate dehydratase [Oscillospiraceae bacterium]|nr:NAD(P)H-hydrate dehydratase [Oscillospiraceae bacterium]
MSEIMSIDRDYVRAALPARREDGHKGSFGKLLVVGGSVGYTGAPYLCAAASVRSGCGLTFLGVPGCIWAVEAAKCVSAMPFPLPDDGAGLSTAALAPLRERLSGCDVLALGPGMGRGEGARELTRSLLRETERAVVLDADGLNALSTDLSALEQRRGRTTVLTPHDGELARLLGISLDELSRRDRAETAREFALAHGCVLVRKGHRTLVALPDGRLLQNTCGGSALSKGGSGDVLTGVIAALLAQGAAPESAAACGVWLHARAGDILAEKLTAYCAAPQDLLTVGLPAAFSECVE